METKTIHLVQNSFEKLKPLTTTVAEFFYNKLFEFSPDLKLLFPCNNKESMTQLGDKFMAVLTSTIDSLNNIEKLTPTLKLLGKRHLDYKVKPIHYDIVGTALLASIANGLQEDFTLEVELAWCNFYTELTNIMQ